ncbi:hypothetical protein HMPREF1557_01688 [Streptococcus sobrinus W1703]|uniref:Uncharacterized protein n=1 Tax=Streptococcus sobrinus W1703 TaxID=1227275 RepID=U2KB56_9STRE|nr:hypothetical protein HMPREF1557_01688 [Streptococcus sobrinus W1703]
MGTVDELDEDYSNWFKSHIWTESSKPWLDYQDGDFYSQTKP